LHNLQQIAVHLVGMKAKILAHLGEGAVLFILLHGEEGQAQEAGSNLFGKHQTTLHPVIK
uniref:hypothetical protein n=1 Tax=Escherichia coli TaxID=562 RepID=UPI0019549F54